MGIAGVRAWLAAVLLPLSFGFASLASAAPIDNVFVFGDSLADVGNLCIAAPGDCPPSPPYAPGRFSNGPVFAEHVAQHFGVTLTPSLLGGTDYAFGGARAGVVDLSIPSPPGILGQVNQFVSDTSGVADPNALYLLSFGGNDIEAALANPADASAILTDAITNYGAMLGALAGAGAKKFAILNVGDLGVTPGVTALGDPAVTAAATQLSSDFNTALAALLTTDPSLSFATVDLFGLTDAAVANPGAFGFTNVTDACFDGVNVCADPNSFLFWDDIHPTAAGHQLIADAVIDQVPEPATLPILLVGLAGVALLRRAGGTARPQAAAR